MQECCIGKNLLDYFFFVFINYEIARHALAEKEKKFTQILLC